MVKSMFSFMTRFSSVAVCAALVIAGSVGGVSGQSADEVAKDAEVGSVTGFRLPRFVSMKAVEANARRGPGVNFPIDWTFIMPGTPLRITDEHGHWRKVEASDGNGGWMHKAMISGRRTVEVIEDLSLMHKRPGEDKWIIAKLKKGVIGDLGKCTGEWCHLTIGKFNGWVRKTSLWGIEGQGN